MKYVEEVIVKLRVNERFQSILLGLPISLIMLGMFFWEFCL